MGSVSLRSAPFRMSAQIVWADPISSDCTLPSTPNRDVWYKRRDILYEEIMHKAWNPRKGFFAQSYEAKVEDAKSHPTSFS